MDRYDRLALIFSLIAVIAAWCVGALVFERLAHLEDEMAYVWEAQVMARGDIMLPSPACQKCYLVPFVVDYQGYRFGKYPPAWPVVLAGATLLHARELANPLLAGVVIWLCYRLIRKLTDPFTGVLAAFLTLTSPFFLVNAGSLLSHIWSLFLTLAFALAWLDFTDKKSHLPKWLLATTAGLSLGVLGLTRPLTAVGVGLPFLVHGVKVLIKGDWKDRWLVITAGGISVITASLLLVWQYALTGDPLLNPYILWWTYDKIGFGPGVGVLPEGHTLTVAISNTLRSFRTGIDDLYGWGKLSVIFLPFGWWAIRRNGRALIISALIPSLLAVYLLYWIGSWLFGPRYYFEALPAVSLLTASGIAWLAGLPFLNGQKWGSLNFLARLRRVSMIGLLALFVSANLIYYLPPRLQVMTGLYGVSRSHLAPFFTPQAQRLTPALVLVHREKRWIEYGTLIELGNPYQDAPFVIVYSQGPEEDIQVIANFPNHTVIDYYPKEPFTFRIRQELRKPNAPTP